MADETFTYTVTIIKRGKHRDYPYTVTLSGDEGVLSEEHNCRLLFPLLKNAAIRMLEEVGENTYPR